MRRSSRFKFFVLTLCAAALCGTPLSAQKQKDEAVSRQFVEGLERARRSTNEGRIFCQVISNEFDTSAIVRNIMQALNITVSASQAAALEKAVRRKFQNTCTQRAKDFVRQEIVMTGSRTTLGGRIMLATKSASGPMPNDALWSLQEVAGGRVLAVDVVLGGRSFVAEAKALVQAALSQNSGDIGAVIEALER